MEDFIKSFETGDKPVADRLLSHTTKSPVINAVTASFKFRSVVAVTMVFLLHLAAYWGWKDIVILLVTEYDCNINDRDDKGHVALHYAAYNGHLDVVKYFLTELRCNPEDRNKTGETPLHLACCYGHLDIVKYLISEAHCNPSCKDNEGETPLHIACHNGNFDIIHYLISQKHCDPSCEDKDGETPLHVACFHRFFDIIEYLLSTGQVNLQAKNNHGDTPFYYATADYKDKNTFDDHNFKIIKLFQPFLEHSELYPVHTYTKVILVGDSGSGKSTVAKRLANKSCKHQPVVVTDVERLTAGIIPHYIQGELGNFVLYDFAGQQDYFSSHEAVLEQLMGKFAAIFVCLIDLSKNEELICESLHYWISFVEIACGTTKCESHMVIVGSHADMVASEEKMETKSMLLQEIAVRRIKHQKYAGYVSMDCRTDASVHLLSPILTKAKECITTGQPFISYYCHVLYAFLRTKINVGCTLDDLITIIAKENDLSLPNDPYFLTELLTTLSGKGLILFIQHLEFSLVIVKIDSLLSDLLGTIFAPSYFKEYCNLASNTGIVPVCNLLKAFPNYNSQMLIEFLTSLNFCRPLDSSMLQYTNLQTTLAYSTADLLFFPGLVKSERPDSLVQQGSLKFGWCLKCMDPHEFLSSRFFHVLLLSVAYKFPLASQSSSSVSGLQCTCIVWRTIDRTGIFWRNLDNITTVIELFDKNRCMLVAMSCDDTSPIEHIELRSSLIALVCQLKQHHCPRLNVAEFLISSDLIQQYPLDNLSDSSDSYLFDMHHVARSMLLRKKCVPSYKDGDSYLKKEEFPFDPYHQLSRSLVCQLLNPKLTDQPIPDHLLQEVHVRKLPCKLKELSKLCELREQLDKLSLFAGRDPLEVAGLKLEDLPHKELDPSTSTVGSDLSSTLSIADLASVKKFLKNLVDWQSLGLELGLLYPKLQIIDKEQRGDITCCKTKMLAAWLQQEDVNQHGVPTRSMLKTALLEIGENELASKIT